MKKYVAVIDAPGYEDFRAVVLLEFVHPDGHDSVVVMCDHKEIYVVKAQHVHPVSP